MSICRNEKYSPNIPDACPVCNALLRSSDKQAYEYSGACSDCTRDFADMNKKEWDAGWRPDSKQVAASLQKRKEEPFFYVNDMYI